MIHAREDYNRIQDPAHKIPADEPVFLLRAQDELACKAVAYYASLCEAAQAPEIAAKARSHSDAMAAWPIKKTPDLPTTTQPTASNAGERVSGDFEEGFQDGFANALQRMAEQPILAWMLTNGKVTKNESEVLAHDYQGNESIALIDRAALASKPPAGEQKPALIVTVTKESPNSITSDVKWLRDFPEGETPLYLGPQLEQVAQDDAVLAFLDDLKDDAIAHIWPDDLERCQTSECVVEVTSVRMGSPDGKTVPLFSREQVAEALRAARARGEGERHD